MPYRVERIDPQRTVMIVVDMENDFVAPGAPLETPAGRAMLPTLKRALSFCRERGIPVIYTTHAHRRPEFDIVFQQKQRVQSNGRSRQRETSSVGW